jgi:hypothetical protein
MSQVATTQSLSGLRNRFARGGPPGVGRKCHREYQCKDLDPRGSAISSGGPEDLKDAVGKLGSLRACSSVYRGTTQRCGHRCECMVHHDVKILDPEEHCIQRGTNFQDRSSGTPCENHRATPGDATTEKRSPRYHRSSPLESVWLYHGLPRHTPMREILGRP